MTFSDWETISCFPILWISAPKVGLLFQKCFPNAHKKTEYFRQKCKTEECFQDRVIFVVGVSILLDIGSVVASSLWVQQVIQPNLNFASLSSSSFLFWQQLLYEYLPLQSHNSFQSNTFNSYSALNPTDLSRRYDHAGINADKLYFYLFIHLFDISCRYCIWVLYT